MIKRPVQNALFISVMTAFYSFLFIFTAEHMEFQSMVHFKKGLQSPFINGFTSFIMGGSMKYIGYAFILIAAAIVIISVIRHKKYDEYQRGVLSKCALAVGVLTIVFVPLLLLCILSDPTYSIEFIFLFITIHWFVVLVTDLVYTIKYA